MERFQNSKTISKIFCLKAAFSLQPLTLETEGFKTVFFNLKDYGLDDDEEDGVTGNHLDDG